jgi:phenylacetic acid degradation protein paaN
MCYDGCAHHKGRMNYFDKHIARLRAADEACLHRHAYSPFIESPSRKRHPEGAKERGLAWFESSLGTGSLGTVFENTGPGGEPIGSEQSPYTGKSLGIQYRQPSIDSMFSALNAGATAWRKASVNDRLGICLEGLDRLATAVFENTYATMHTTGQSFVMAFAGSGANSLDRGLEALVYAYRAMREIPETAQFARKFGAQEATLTKRYALMPRGPALVITCGSYPAWNAYPAIFANLATGNPVIVKPHPATILPVARAVQILRETLADAGFDPNLVIMAPDTASAPIAKHIAMDTRIAIIDFTGGREFGDELETCSRALTYTETAGCNAVLLDSADDFDAVISSLAYGLSLFSGQMCTTPQNIYIPAHLESEQLATRLTDALDAISLNADLAAGVCGAVHSQQTIERSADLRDHLGDGETLVRDITPYSHPVFEAARTATPMLIKVDPERSNLHRREQFGPVAFLIPVGDREQALALAAKDAANCGAIASYAYSTDPSYRAHVEDELFSVGASVGFNLIRHRPMNYTAAFSDYHVTGLNPAGNASLTDLAFVANRFRIVQSKTEL